LRRGWRVGRLFEEPADARLADRRSLLRDALERVESRESDGLVVARFKNLGSSLEDAVAALERIQAAGGRFVSVCEGIDLGGSTGYPILRLLLSVLEW
jgi:DNA invertase Pin-like site-specific DNA recombinase